MRWKQLRRSQNVEDRRGRAPAVAAGVGGLGIIGVLLALLLGGGEGGFDIGGALESLGAASGTQPPQSLSPAATESGEFIEAILGSTEEYWGGVFHDAGRDYPEPTLVLFSAATNSACGGARSAIGPHYCPPDSTVYMDLGFFDELSSRFGATGGDFAEAYVVAHEVGHHVQNALGIMTEVRDLQQSAPGDANELSVRLELQADCFADAWANSIFTEGVLEAGDIEEGLDAAASVGDDRIQETMTGSVNPEAFTHGTSQQRVRWFLQGYESGDPNTCDTYSGGV
jgi:hypothetical protein